MYGQEHRIGSKLNKAACKPLTPIEYIAEILTPEVGSRLIQQDYSAHQGSSSSDGGGISLEKARTIMKESWDYGRIMFDEYSDHEEEEWENNKCISDWNGGGATLNYRNFLFRVIPFE